MNTATWQNPKQPLKKILITCSRYTVLKKDNGGFDWVKKVYQRECKGYLKVVVVPDNCKIVYFRFDPTLHYDDEKCYELNNSYKVSFDTEDAIALLRDYIMDYDKE